MNRRRWLGLLMIIAIVGITGFQVYWLRQNYAREKGSMRIRSEMLFRETILQLQVTKLRLDVQPPTDTTTGKVKIIMHDDKGEQVKIGYRKGEEMISTVNVIRNKLKPVHDAGGKKNMIISMNQSFTTTDSNFRVRTFKGPRGRGDRIVNLLYSVDSLQEPLRIGEIDTMYRASLQESNINIPFTIIESDTVNTDDPEPGVVTVGFSNPVSYRLVTGNTFPYLFRQILQPILFSILLLGITILSFVLLYRNLLKQERLAALKNEFISNITHELKTPISTVGVAIEALKNFNAMNDQRKTAEYLDISQNELNRLSLLVDKVLRLSMFEKKEIELKYEILDMGSLVEEVTSSLKLQLEKAGANLSIRKEGDLSLEGDRLHLLSVVFNLVDNAIKYSSAKPEIDVSIQEKENQIMLEVSDRGIGIPAPYRAKVFEKFFRVPHGDTHNAPGYGLGLSYACQVINKHGGEIKADGREGGGTIFSITVPKNRV